MRSEGLPAAPGARRRAVAAGLAHASALALALLLVFAAARPLTTDDLWWHLALGEAYLDEGPWLRADPLLHTATAAPPPAAWLADLLLASLDRGFGFAGLRVAHAAAILAILAFAWTRFRRASGSWVAASFGVACTGALGAYRLFQLRPELASHGAALALVALVLRDRERPGWAPLAAAVALCAAWANLHAAFALGPLLLCAAAAGAALEIPWQRGAQRSSAAARARRLGFAALAAALAACANPSGPAAYLPVLSSGAEGPDLGEVGDEWARFEAFSLPVANLPPSPLVFGLVWLLLLATPLASAAWLRRLRGGRLREPDLDPALVGIALASLIAMLAAIRFVWMGVFPLWLLAQLWRELPSTPRRRAGIALATCALLPGFLWLGDWPLLSRGLSAAPAFYLEPYAARKYQAHAAWFLKDSGLRGKLYNPYFAGGFLGYWLRPELQVFANGSLNVPADVMQAYHAIQAGGSDPAARDPGAALDAYGVDLFFGVGVPAPPPPNRPWQYTASHLERDPDWMPIFRNASSAVYLRRGERNRENLERVANYYAREGVPFDPERGLDPEQVLRNAPAWAVAHALVPVDFAQLARLSAGVDPIRRAGVLSRLAHSYAWLGIYERSLALDRRLLGLDPLQTSARRRAVWALLRLDRAQEALAEARRLRERAPADEAAAHLEQAAQAYASAGDREQRNALAATLVYVSREEAATLASRYRAPELRARRR